MRGVNAAPLQLLINFSTAETINGRSSMHSRSLYCDRPVFKERSSHASTLRSRSRWFPSDEWTLPGRLSSFALWEPNRSTTEESYFPKRLSWRGRKCQQRCRSDDAWVHVIKLKKGNDTMRDVTTIAGATSMTLRCEFRDKNELTVGSRD